MLRTILAPSSATCRATSTPATQGPRPRARHIARHQCSQSVENSSPLPAAPRLATPSAAHGALATSPARERMENVVDAIERPWAGECSGASGTPPEGLDHIGGTRCQHSPTPGTPLSCSKGEASHSDRRHKSIAAPPHRRDGQPARRPRDQDIARRHGSDTPHPRKREIQSASAVACASHSHANVTGEFALHPGPKNLLSASGPQPTRPEVIHRSLRYSNHVSLPQKRQ